jgi:CHAD domain-containing protein
MLRAGSLALPICEFELEQVSGDTTALLDQARDWTARHRLILDLRSKAERGDALARMALTHIPASADDQLEALATVPEFAPIMLKPRKAGSVTVRADMGLIEAFLACATDCVNQIVRNATFLAGVDSGQATHNLRTHHLHQLRVGIRRLRSCWSFFGKWIRLDRTQREADLGRFFSRLGQKRDADVVRRTIAPRLKHAGMRDMTSHEPGSDDGWVAELVGSPDFQASMLALVGQLLAASDSISKGEIEGEAAGNTTGSGTAPADILLVENVEQDLSTLLTKRLNRWLKRVCREGEEFETLPNDTQHDVRKKIKRLRYSMEFAAGVLSEKSFQRLRRAVTAAQETLE